MQQLLVEEKVRCCLARYPDLAEYIRNNPPLFAAGLSGLREAIRFRQLNNLEDVEEELNRLIKARKYFNGSTLVTVGYNGHDVVVPGLPGPILSWVKTYQETQHGDPILPGDKLLSDLPPGTFPVRNIVLYPHHFPEDARLYGENLDRRIAYLEQLATTLRNIVSDAMEQLFLIMKSEEMRKTFVVMKRKQLEQGSPSVGDKPDPSIQVCLSWLVRCEFATALLTDKPL